MEFHHNYHMTEVKGFNAFYEGEKKKVPGHTQVTMDRITRIIVSTTW